uniref:Uncharacterized protein n=1 Tax=Athene cunicularia TaxID=194338 RepID=A0A663LX94_ATHCN
KKKKPTKSCFFQYQLKMREGGSTKTDHLLQKHTSDKYLTSEKWLQKYGLKAQKLTLYDALADCTFRHADGIVDIKTKPEDVSLQTDAVSIVNFPSSPVSCFIFILKIENLTDR